MQAIYHLVQYSLHFGTAAMSMGNSASIFKSIHSFALASRKDNHLAAVTWSESVNR